MQHRELLHSGIRFYLTVIIAFLLPLGRWVNILILLLVLHWLMEGRFKEKRSLIISCKRYWLAVSLYVLYALGIFYSSNLDAGLFDLQLKLSLLLFPLVFVSAGRSDKRMYHIGLAFVSGCFTACFICLSNAFDGYWRGGTYSFYYTAFSILLHPAYFSMYLNMAILILLQIAFRTDRSVYKYTAVLVAVFFSFIVVLLSSKLGLLSMLCIHLASISYYIVKERKYILGIGALAGLVISLFLLVKHVPFVANRLKPVQNLPSMKTIAKSNSESTAVRIMVWDASLELIREHYLFGVGTGDVKDKLLEKYKEKGITAAYQYKLNAHNQFLQTFAALGIPGILSLILGIGLPLLYAFKADNYLYLFFLLIITVNFLTESMLETQAGVMFYAFFNSLFLFRQLSDKVPVHGAAV